ncbi:hypothetical protein [Microbacterium galbinum]|uniref:Secreted protein n=1 Tax=Microbacterium galbinum TaxID=2851646 RepID=A0ABY4IN69_9MICO|nr:hypothetical protein [Microbacterium galbinum]UPL13028.1 hypothetical protein KV396_00325 [Microbacterium galbinum]
MTTKRVPAKSTGCSTLTAVVVLLIALVIGGVVWSNNQRADWEARSGSAPVQLGGTLQTEEWQISSAVLDIDARYETTKLVITLNGVGRPYRDPDIRVTFDSGLTCQVHDGWRYSPPTAHYYCDGYLPMEEVDSAGIGTVQFLE